MADGRPIWPADAAQASSDAALPSALAVWRAGEKLLLDRDPSVRRVGLAILRWLDGDSDAASLDVALGLAGPGRTGARQRFRVATRDALLRTVAEAHWPDDTPASAAREIARRWRRYAAVRWPRDRDAGTEPPEEVDKTFCNLLRRGHEPLSERNLRRILGG